MNRVVIIGGIAVDVICETRAALNQTYRIGFGGVCKHAACALGVSGIRPRFLTVNYKSELAHSLSDCFKSNSVEWTTFPAYGSLSLFQAIIDTTGRIAHETFYKGGIDLITPELLRKHTSLIEDADVIVSCTDLSLESLNELRALASDIGAIFCVLCTSKKESSKISMVSDRPDFVSLNIEEMESLVGEKLESFVSIAELGSKLVSHNGIFLVTLGNKGAVLYHKELAQIYYQPVNPLACGSIIGAGDVLFASLMAHHLRGNVWDEALRMATSYAQRYILHEHEAQYEYDNFEDDFFSLPALETTPIG